MLTDTDRAILDLAAEPWRGRGWMERRAHEIGMTGTRYYQRLDALIRTRDAIEYDPVTCRRLRDVTEAA